MPCRAMKNPVARAVGVSMVAGGRRVAHFSRQHSTSSSTAPSPSRHAAPSHVAATSRCSHQTHTSAVVPAAGTVGM